MENCVVVVEDVKEVEPGKETETVSVMQAFPVRPVTNVPMVFSKSPTIAKSSNAKPATSLALDSAQDQAQPNAWPVRKDI